MTKDRRSAWMMSGSRAGLLLGVGFGLLPLAACSSAQSAGPGSTADGAAASADDASPSCASNGMVADVYSPGMKKAGTDGVFTFEIVSAFVGADPAPPTAPKVNVWTLRVTDKTGAVVKDAAISLPETDSPKWTFGGNPWMPVMHHGSSVVTTYTNNGDGTASAKIDFSMSGYWKIYVTATSGATTDSAVFSFCLP